MMDTKQRETGIKTAKLVLLVAAVYLGMKFIFPIVLPFLAALVLARLLYPLAEILEKKARLKRSLARFAAYSVFLMGTGLLAAAFLYLCYRMGSSCLEQVKNWKEGISVLLGTCCDKIEQVSGFDAQEIRQNINEGAIDFTGGAVAYSKDAGWYMIGFLAKLFVTFVATFLILNDYEKIMEGLIGTEAGKRIRTLLGEGKTAFGAYLLAQLRIMGTVMLVCIAGLLILKIPHAVWIGIAIGLFDALPFFGTGTVFVPWALLALLLGFYPIATGCICLYFVCSFIRQFLEPKLVGNSLGVPPLAVLMSVYIGVWIYGGIGVLTGPLSALIVYEVLKGSSKGD